MTQRDALVVGFMQSHMPRHSALTSFDTFHRGACNSVGTKSRRCWKRGTEEKDGEKKKKVRDGVGKGSNRGGGCGQGCRA